MQIIKRKPGAEKRSVILPMAIPVEPEEYDRKPVENRVAIFDTETDPFQQGLIVKPFTCGFYVPDIDFYKDFWGDDCIHQFFAWLLLVTGDGEIFESQKFSVFVHNGGNFDFYFVTDYFDSGHKPFIINGRLVRIQCQGHEFRDSYSMMPVPLGDYDKLPIDYDKMQRWLCSIVDTRETMMVREYFKDEIRTYQKRDCTSLGELVMGWLDMFGNRLTMASVALPMLRSYHGFETMWEETDKRMRPYYFGGRNQCFATGTIRGNFNVYDINSSYPDVMRRYKHPISAYPNVCSKITERTHFAHIRAWSNGALPVRRDDGSLSFPIGKGDFYACIHEINAGLATGTLRIIKVYEAIEFDLEADFAEFIDTFYKLRLDAAANEDEIRKLFYKLVMNSSYGKFAQDPRKYETFVFDPAEPPTPEYCVTCHRSVKDGILLNPCTQCAAELSSPWGWSLHSMCDGKQIYSAPQRVRSSSFYNVATAASITSAARASLLFGINAATRPLYCDTDSLICEGMAQSENIRFHEKELGAWKTEASGNTVAIAGKKLYAVFNDGEVIKKASKGVKLTAEQILRVCNGEVIEYANPVPKFHLGGDASFITRRIQRTA